MALVLCLNQRHLRGRKCVMNQRNIRVDICGTESNSKCRSSRVKEKKNLVTRPQDQVTCVLLSGLSTD